jgi:branched-chain amino acid transport system ATP-binding protein
MLEVHGVDVYHGDLQALWDISFYLDEGEIVTLIGANGAGKSTTLETIAGLLAPAKGSVIFDSVHLDKEPSQRIVQLGICLIPEDRGIFTGMSVLENLELGAFNKRSRKVKDESIEFVYEMFPILKVRTRQVAGTLSGGERSMLAIGRGLMAKPKLLMLDEPSLGLAPLVVKNIFDAIRKINNAGVGILLVEQNLHAALRLAKRAYIIANGRIVQQGDAKSILSDEQVKDAYLGTG